MSTCGGWPPAPTRPRSSRCSNASAVSPASASSARDRCATPRAARNLRCCRSHGSGGGGFAAIARGLCLVHHRIPT
eukprot:362818-Chlamydomonas_euryale.AAC.1